MTGSTAARRVTGCAGSVDGNRNGWVGDDAEEALGNEEIGNLGELGSGVKTDEEEDLAAQLSD